MQKQPNRILVTGGAGFIGSRLVCRLAEKECTRIWVLDNLHPQVHGNGTAPSHFPPNVAFARGDIRDIDLLSSLVREAQPQVVFHLAAETGTGQSYEEPTRYSSVNVLGTAKLIETLRRSLSGEPLRFVLASSRAVYGEGLYRRRDGSSCVAKSRELALFESGRYDPTDEQGELLTPVPTREDIPPHPSSVYASTKLMQELLLLQCAAGTAWLPVILRLQNVYGPGQSMNNPYTGVLSAFARQVLEERVLDIYEDGRIVRDFVFVDDVVEALLASINKELAFGTLLNIGSGRGVTILAAACMLLKLLHAPADRYHVSGKYRLGDVRHAVADISQAEAVLEWSPRTSLEEGLGQLAEWCRKGFDKARNE